MQPDQEPRRHPQVVHLDELAGHTVTGDAIASTMKQLGAATRNGMLGCTYYEVPPGRSGFPYHFHCVNEEALFVLEGEATRLARIRTLRDAGLDLATIRAVLAGTTSLGEALRQRLRAVETEIVALRQLAASRLAGRALSRSRPAHGALRRARGTAAR